MEFINLKRQYAKYKNEIDARINKVLSNGAFIMGPEISELEEKLSEYVGVKHCIAVASGTDSLEIALRALNIGPNDEVITVPFSWISTIEVIVAVGATPVLVDIQAESFNINVDLIEAAITKRTKAIIPVSLFGQVAELERINDLAEKYGIAVIEDGAQSFGATRSGYRSCGNSTIASTSFFPTKPLGCYGDGGALFTNDDDLANAIRAIRSHGATERHNHLYVGINGRLDTIQGAVLLAKWPYFEDEIRARIKIGERYTTILGGQVLTPVVLPSNSHVFAQYTVRVPKEIREFILKGLKDFGIPAGIYYPYCFHEQPAYDFLGYKYGSFPEAEKASREVLSLPMSPYLTIEEQDKVCRSLILLLNKKKAEAQGKI